jgi:hypothetical protein
MHLVRRINAPRPLVEGPALIIHQVELLSPQFASASRPECSSTCCCHSTRWLRESAARQLQLEVGIRGNAQRTRVYITSTNVLMVRKWIKDPVTLSFAACISCLGSRHTHISTLYVSATWPCLRDTIVSSSAPNYQIVQIHNDYHIIPTSPSVTVHSQRAAPLTNNPAVFESTSQAYIVLITDH